MHHYASPNAGHATDLHLEHMTFRADWNDVEEQYHGYCDQYPHVDATGESRIEAIAWCMRQVADEIDGWSADQLPDEDGDEDEAA